MDFDDIVQQDQQAKQWLRDIESLRSPPPPRKLTSADVGSSSRENSLFSNAAADMASYRNQQMHLQPAGIMNGDSTVPSTEDSDYDFLGKVKQFQSSNSHPYANKSRVETAKKIAAQGRSAGLISPTGETAGSGKRAGGDADGGKKIISKQQVDELRNNVRRETRPLNPYPNPDKNPNPNMDIREIKLHVDNASLGGAGDYSSSAYSSYSSGELSKSAVGSFAPIVDRNGVNNAAPAPPPPTYRNSDVIGVTAAEPLYRKLEPRTSSLNTSMTTSANPNTNKEYRQVSEPAPSMRSDNNNIVINDRDLLAVFDDFDKDYRNLSSLSIDQNRSISKSPNRLISDNNGDYANYGKQNGGDYRSSSLSGDYRSPTNGTVRPPPYRAPPGGRLQSPGGASATSPANHYRQSSSPIATGAAAYGALQSPSVRNPAVAAAAARNGARNLNRSQSMQDSIQQQPIAAPPANNYERMTSGRDIIVDRIPRSATSEFEGFTRNFLANTHPYEQRAANGKPPLGGARYGGGVDAPTGHVMVVHGQQHQQSWESPKYGNRYGSSDALEEQQRKFLQLEAQVEREMQSKAIDYGVCYHCSDKVTNVNEATQALGHLYHAKCFACCSCGRALKGKKFYEVRGQVYCEEDYLFSGFQQSAERCAVCGHLIMDMILQAVGKSFHPGCFRCVSCKESLDGVPFTMDDQERVYCINDYHRLFAPKCAKCSKPITPSVGRDETVRVVAMQKNYHVDCYVCEGCGLQLTDEPEKRCYPLGEHLLCHRCHIHWSRTGGTVHPITDL